jgi:hypothetical protein
VREPRKSFLATYGGVTNTAVVFPVHVHRLDERRGRDQWRQPVSDDACIVSLSRELDALQKIAVVPSAWKA